MDSNSVGDVNPFSSPGADFTTEASPTTVNPWKEIAVRWERLRLPYNGVVGGVGLLALLLVNHQHGLLDIIGGALVWAAAANVCYLFGPVVQMYACWFAEGKQDAGPSAAESLAGSHAFTWLIFLSGTGFSLLLTLVTVMMQDKFWLT